MTKLQAYAVTIIIAIIIISDIGIGIIVIVFVAGYVLKMQTGLYQFCDTVNIISILILKCNMYCVIDCVIGCVIVIDRCGDVICCIICI